MSPSLTLDACSGRILTLNGPRATGILRNSPGLTPHPSLVAASSVTARAHPGGSRDRAAYGGTL